MNLIEIIIIGFLVLNIILTAVAEPSLSFKYWAKFSGSAINLGKKGVSLGITIAKSFTNKAPAVNNTTEVDNG